MTNPVTYETQGAIAVLRINNPPVNALSQAVRQGLSDGMDRAEADRDVKAVLIVGEGRAFIAGADITEFGKLPMEPNLPDLCTRIESSPLLVAASMHGVTLGGGLEVALGTHYRIAQPTARLGLPEVHLGLLPGAGGTQRLPRLTGADKAIEIMISGRQIKAAEALELGLLDKVEEGDPQEVGLAFVNELLANGAPRRAVSELPAAAPIDWEAAHAGALKKGRGQINVGTIVRAVQAASELGFAEGMERERGLFMELLQSDQSKGMIHAFFNERAVSNLPELKGVAPRALNAIGVIGGGTMGAGIATAALLAKLDVVLIETGQEQADAARGRIEGNLQGALKRGKISQPQYDALTTKALTLATNYASLGEVDLVVEAVFEDMAVKKEVFAKLDAACKQGAILASNTSYLDVDEIAAATSRPEDVIGLHFFSPAHVMKLLEVVVADKTAADVVATGFELGKRLGKISVRSGVCDGFIGNRILAAYRTAADHMVLDGASPYQIDSALTGFGFAMGPFAVGDLAGLDIGWMTRKRKAADRHPDERVPTYADRLCEEGHFGRKTGAGYYLYEAGSRASVPNPRIPELIAAEQAELNITPRDFSDEEIVRRYMCAMVNEAAKVVEEGIARRPADVDMVLLFGYGFPRYGGGPLKWADLQGLAGVLADIEHYAQEDAWFWKPAPLLKSLVADGRSFDDLNRAGG
ncbi:3-hydroxyacyl-CoA dehydrogenase NAD-binding domain-containing protein [Sulfitobacter donghicola]|uniref:3-hydroxyacyl-CoA dehydrogenase n=1 Tax=Sulfitobacter donghicola DSW-25 = KCTC 12864 = JCM 14565 TaxID=1300350 RepID=A0A073IJJ8_9RHOB|nr:3-hydroxyacyl-CoA dehydrogenase NAD-binding domain-containing protein [Sulfitobacter donghicola]KEJ89701.1 3-hydroxyacyl-CoA dehydrogenase [Sulfitobacter donghicola DSW-25 = KCTC 12864 = JCM 14565]KIN67206.1 Enoyl-CoA hydratase/isomerase/3-hydroxyacyl-CoA dehydrogenase [Sulfitobacter donghicola DSW-25 = KCTC 12864 = JCM 14565]